MDLRPLSMAEILDRSFQVYRRHFATLFVVAVVTLLPAVVLYTMAGEPVTPGADPSVSPFFWVVAIVAIPITALGWAALTEVAHRGALDRGPVAGEALSRGLRLTLRTVGFGIVGYVLLVAAVLAMVLPAGVVAAVGMSALEGAGGLLTVGIIAVLVLVGLAVGAVVLTWWGAVLTVGLPVLVVEDVGVFSAIRRAHTLSRGARLRIVTVGFVAWLAVMLPTMGVFLVFAIGSAAWDPQAALSMTTGELWLQNVLLGLSGILTTPFVVASMVWIYLDRRIRCEGLDVELASASLASGLSSGD